MSTFKRWTGRTGDTRHITVTDETGLGISAYVNIQNSSFQLQDVNRLKQGELVRTERKNRDKRFINVTLTAKGRKVLKQSTPVAREIVNRVMLSISEGDAVLLEKPLRVLRQNAHYGLERVAKHSQPPPR